jgi:hypothetical protein
MERQPRDHAVSGKTRVTRTVVRYQFDPAPGTAGGFNLVAFTEHQVADGRAAGCWLPCGPAARRQVITPVPLTRYELAELTGNAAHALEAPD